MLYRCVWDLEANKRKQEFEAHNGDVCTLSLAPDLNTYVTGSVDRTCKLWDIREPNCKQVFYGHQEDINAVCVGICITIILYKLLIFKNTRPMSLFINIIEIFMMTNVSILISIISY